MINHDNLWETNELVWHRCLRFRLTCIRACSSWRRSHNNNYTRECTYTHAHIRRTDQQQRNTSNQKTDVCLEFTISGVVRPTRFDFVFVCV